MSQSKVVFELKDDAQKLVDAKNSEPLPEGKEKRTPFKVYRLWQGDVERFVAAQSPMAALHQGHTEFGINVENAGEGGALLPLDQYLSRLSPEQIAEARKFLGA